MTFTFLLSFLVTMLANVSYSSLSVFLRSGLELRQVCFGWLCKSEKFAHVRKEFGITRRALADNQFACSYDSGIAHILDKAQDSSLTAKTMRASYCQYVE